MHIYTYNMNNCANLIINLKLIILPNVHITFTHSEIFMLSILLNQKILS